MSSPVPQRFSLRRSGRTHTLEVSGRGRAHLVWRCDGEVLARADSLQEQVSLQAPEGSHRVDVRLTRLGRVRRATLVTAGEELDLDPEPGSPAARRLERERARPLLYGLLDVLVAVGGVVLPLLGLGALVRGLLDPVLGPLLAWAGTLVEQPLAWLRGHTPWIELPSIDLPDLPRLDLSWIPQWTPPPPIAWTLEHLDLIFPVLLAAGLARHEVTRRRRQDAAKAELVQHERAVLLERLAADLHALTQRVGDR